MNKPCILVIGANGQIGSELVEALAQRHGHERLCSAALLAATVASFFTIGACLALLPASWLPAH